MKPILIITATLFVLTSCGGRGQKNTAYSVEDTVRYQIGGELFYPDIDPSDSITVIKTRYEKLNDGTLYREYGYIVHDRNTQAYKRFDPASLDVEYQKWRELDYYESQADTLPTGEIDPAIVRFNGYWLTLTEHDGDYYFSDYMGELGSFLIADSVVHWFNMDGIFARKIRHASVDGDNLLFGYKDGVEEKLELVDPQREIYRNDRNSFFTRAHSIRNFEMIKWVNNTGDVM